MDCKIFATVVGIFLVLTVTTVSAGVLSVDSAKITNKIAAYKHANGGLQNTARFSHDDNEDFYRQVMDIPENIALQTDSINKVVQRNISDSDNLQRVAYISKLTVIENREYIANELLGMNKQFIRKLAARAMENNQVKSGITQQISRYVTTRTTGIHVAIDEARIRQLFEKKIDMDELISGIKQGL